MLFHSHLRNALVAVALASVGLTACDRNAPAPSADAGKKNAPATAQRPGEHAASAVPQRATPEDAGLAGRVKSALVSEPGLKGVEVNVADGVVTLVGTAESAAASHQAAIVAMNISGVRSVRNELIVNAGS